MLTTAPLIVGFFIILLQIGPFLGHPASANVIESVSKFSYFLTYANPAAAGLGILTLGIVLGSPAKLSRLIPSPLLALIVGTLAAVFFLPNRDLRLIGRYILPKFTKYCQNPRLYLW